MLISREENEWLYDFIFKDERSSELETQTQTDAGVANQ